MRRGYRDRWAYDNNPHDQGIATVPTLFQPRHFATVAELAVRDKTPGTIKLLAKYGWLPK